MQHSWLEIAGRLHTLSRHPKEWLASPPDDARSNSNGQTSKELGPPAMAPPSIENAVRGPMIIPCPT